MLQDSTVPIYYYNIILSALNHVLGRYTPIYYIYYNIDKSTIGTALSYRGTHDDADDNMIWTTTGVEKGLTTTTKEHSNAARFIL